YRLQGNSKSLNMGRVSGTISPDGRFCAVNRSYDSIRVWDMSLGAVIRIIPNVAGNYPDEHWSCIEYVSEDFSCTPDGENFLSGNFQNLFFLEFSDDARKLIFPTIEGKSIVYDLQTDRRDTLQGFVQGVDWNKELAFVIEDYQLKIVSLKTREVKLTWIPIGKSDFVVKHPSGLFDASPNAMSRLHFVQGLDVIQFDQLKARYYEPQLLKKVLAGEDLRKVDEFDSIELPPDIHLSEVDDKGYITIDLMNRGGGIGEVSLYINGKEAIKDARKPKMNPDADKLSLKIFVS